MNTNKKNYLYLFLDEGGNFDFSVSGTKYFTITSVSKIRPFESYMPLINLKHNLIESGLDLEYFHASEDRQTIREKVFKIINKNLDKIRIDCGKRFI